MSIQQFGEVLKQAGVRKGSGVPCSFFTSLVNYMATNEATDYLGATSEGEAVAIAAGLVTAGHPSFALMQNSGLGNAVNPITSMLYTYQIPVVLFVSHRGGPGIVDEPQHELMGKITAELCDLCTLRTHGFDASTFAVSLDAALRDGVPSAWIFKKGALEGGKALPAPSLTFSSRPISVTSSPRTFTPVLKREQALESILPVLGGSALSDGKYPAVISTTGKLSRELYELDDQDNSRSNRFYMVGSMGCAAGFGLGVARARPERKVIVLDGDGALLMKLGSLATIGHYHAPNLHHVVFDNGTHESTGGQPTVSPSVDFPAIAHACGYRRADTAAQAEEIYDLIHSHLSSEGPTLLRIVIQTGARRDLGRPKLKPRAAWCRFRDFLCQSPR